MFNRMISIGSGCCLLLAILALGACSDSSDSSVVSKSWSSLGIADSYEMQSVRAIGSRIYAGGLGSNNYVSLRIFENNAQAANLVVSETLGVNWGICDDAGGNIYLGWYSPFHGYVYKYDPDSGAITDMSVPAAKMVFDVFVHNSKAYVAGVWANPVIVPFSFGEVWEYDGSVWTGMPAVRLVGVETLIFFRDTLYIAGVSGETGQAQIWAYLDGVFSMVDFPYEAGEIYVFATDSTALYAGGFASDLSGQVWKYDGNTWSSLNIQNCSVINALRVSSDGILYAGGIDSDNKGQVWMYGEDNNTWTSTGLTNSVVVNDLTEASNGAIYAVGQDSNRNGQMWKYE